MDVTPKTLVHLAEEGDLQGIETRLDAGEDVNRRDPDGRAALHAALAEGHEATVRFLLARGADPTIADASGYTVLHWASRSDDVAMIRLAQEANPLNVDVPDLEGRTPLSWVSQGNDLRSLEWLIAQGADANHVDLHGWGPLHYAAADGHDQAVERLLEAGAHPLLRLPPNDTEEFGPLPSDLARNFAPHSPRTEALLETAESTPRNEG